MRVAEPTASAVCAAWDVVSGTGHHSSQLPQPLVQTILVDELTEARDHLASAKK